MIDRDIREANIIIKETINKLIRYYELKNINLIDSTRTETIRTIGTSFILYRIDGNNIYFDNITSDNITVRKLPKLELNLMLLNMLSLYSNSSYICSLLEQRLSGLFEYITYFDNLNLNINFYIHNISYQHQLNFDGQSFRIEFSMTITDNGDSYDKFQREYYNFGLRNNWFEPNRR